MFGLDGTRLDPSSGTPNSALAGLQKKKIIITVQCACCPSEKLARKISKVAFFGHSNGQFSTYIQDYALHTHIKDFFVHLRVWLSRRLYSKDSNEVGKVANDSTSLFSWKSASMLSMMSTISPRIRFLPSSSLFSCFSFIRPLPSLPDLVLFLGRYL